MYNLYRPGNATLTGARVRVHAKRIPFFKPSKELRGLVDGGGTASTKWRCRKVFISRGADFDTTPTE